MTHPNLALQARQQRFAFLFAMPNTFRQRLPDRRVTSHWIELRIAVTGCDPVSFAEAQKKTRAEALVV
jgi:hypothetical protein